MQKFEGRDKLIALEVLKIARERVSIENKEIIEKLATEIALH